MQIILLERVENLGVIGDQVTVKPGYARNYLLPQKIALRATKENLAYFETQKVQLEADNLKQRKEAEKIAEKMKSLELIMIRQAGEGSQLYGSVNANDIAKAITEQGFTIKRTQIALDHPIKMLGLHQARVNLHPEVSVSISLNVAKSAEEAKVQKEAIIAEAAALAEKAEQEKQAAKIKKSKAKAVKAEAEAEDEEEMKKPEAKTAKAPDEEETKKPEAKTAKAPDKEATKKAKAAKAPDEEVAKKPKAKAAKKPAKEAKQKLKD